MKMLSEKNTLLFKAKIEDIPELKEKVKSAKKLFSNIKIYVIPNNCEIDYAGYGGTINHKVELEKIGKSWLYIKSDKYTKVQPYRDFLIEINYQ